MPVYSDNKIDLQAIFKAKQALNDFLAKHPDMRGMQSKVDSLLGKMASQELRLEVINKMLAASLRELSSKIKELKTEIK